jgi:hypothetical protein
LDVVRLMNLVMDFNFNRLAELSRIDFVNLFRR